MAEADASNSGDLNWADAVAAADAALARGEDSGELVSGAGADAGGGSGEAGNGDGAGDVEMEVEEAENDPTYRSIEECEAILEKARANNRRRAERFGSEYQEPNKVRCVPVPSRHTAMRAPP